MLRMRARLLLFTTVPAAWVETPSFAAHSCLWYHCQGVQTSEASSKIYVYVGIERGMHGRFGRS